MRVWGAGVRGVGVGVGADALVAASVSRWMLCVLWVEGNVPGDVLRRTSS